MVHRMLVGSDGGAAAGVREDVVSEKAQPYRTAVGEAADRPRRQFDLSLQNSSQCSRIHIHRPAEQRDRIGHVQSFTNDQGLRVFDPYQGSIVSLAGFNPAQKSFGA